MAGSEGTTTTETAPWSGAKPHVLEFYKRARDFLDQPMQQYAGDRIAPESALTIAGFDAAKEYARTDTADALRGFAGEAMGGFAANPMLDQTFDAAARGITRNFQRTVVPGIDSRFAAAGRTGSSANQRALEVGYEGLGNSLNDLATQFYYRDYENRMGDRFKGAELLAGADQLEQGKVNFLAGTGAREEYYGQRVIDDLIQRFQFQQQEPQARLDTFGQRVGAGGNYSTTTGVPTGAGGSDPALAIGLGLLSAIATIYSGGSAAALIPGAVSVGSTAIQH